MAAITASQVSLFPPEASNASEWAEGGPVDKHHIVRRLRITGVTAGDTATAEVLGLSHLLFCSSGFSNGSVVPCAIDPTTDTLVIGTGPSADDLYLTVGGVPTIA